MTAYFQTVATVIPVLLVAGMLNPRLLREYSKSSRTAKYLKFQIGFALFGTLVAIAFTTSQDFQQPENGDWREWLYYLVVIFITIVPVASTTSFVYSLARFALDENPHPKRLESEKQELERSLASLQRKLDELGNEEPEGAEKGND